MPVISYQYRCSAGVDRSAYLKLSSTVSQQLTWQLGVKEWLLLGYCHEWELFIVSADTDADILSIENVWEILQKHRLVSAKDPREQKMVSGKDAVQRFLKIATGIMNPRHSKELLEILRESYVTATDHGTVGAILQRLFNRGIWLHEKARQETDYYQIAVLPQSVLRELAEKILGPLTRAAVYIVGDDSFLVDILDTLYQSECRQLFFLGPQDAVDPKLLLQYSVSLQESKSLSGLPAKADVVIVFSSETHQLSDAIVQQRMQMRHHAPLVIFDFAGSDLNDKKLNKINNLYIYTQKDIDSVIHYNLAEQQNSVKVIEQWIYQEIEAFYQWLSSEDRYQFAGIIGAATQMRQIFELISRISQTDITVLIDGESGTGKELVARAIHQLSARADRPFMPVNCGAIPENLLESELFGHQRGAFTGAVAQKAGFFEVANGGTIFLDEIAELPQHLQVKLLRFLQNGEIKRVGSNTTIKVDVRVLAATNRDLMKMVERGEFRSDLFYRLNVIQLTVPPLRERRDDIPLLAKHFLRIFSRKLHKEVSDISPETLAAIRQYHWPGNVRELENAMERAVALSLGRAVALYDLPPAIQNNLTTNNVPRSGERMTLKELEKNYILETLEACNWNYELACKQLAIGRTTLWRKVREYNLEKPI